MKKGETAKGGGRKWEWILVAAVLLGCAAAGFWLYRPKGGETIAVISVDSAELMRLDLTRAKDGIFSIEEQTGKPVSFEVKDHAVRFVNVTCPDHVCEKAGWCGAPGERAVCLPNRTTLICYAADELAG